MGSPAPRSCWATGRRRARATPSSSACGNEPIAIVPSWPRRAGFWGGEAAARKRLEDVCQGAGESRQDVFALEGAVSGNDGLGAVLPVYACNAPQRIDDPYQARRGAQPVRNLSEDLTRPVVGRQDLDNEIGRQIREAPRVGRRLASLDRA